MPWSARTFASTFDMRYLQMKRGSDMKIVTIDNLLMRVERQNWHVVKITTDEGIVGYGEASVEGRERTVAAAVDELSRYLIGEDPTPIEHHWQRLNRHGFWRGGDHLELGHLGDRPGALGHQGQARSACRSTSCWAARPAPRPGVHAIAAARRPRRRPSWRVELVEQGYRAMKLGTCGRRRGAGRARGDPPDGPQDRAGARRRSGRTST